MELCIWEETSLLFWERLIGELVAYSGCRWGAACSQVVNASVTFLNHVSNFSDHAVHQL